eukprot:gene9399-9563_t
MAYLQSSCCLGMSLSGCRMILVVLLTVVWSCVWEAHTANGIAVGSMPQLPVLSIPAPCSSPCSSLSAGFLPATCMFCLINNGALPSYRVPGAPPCIMGDPTEYVWECRQVLAGLAAANSSSVAPPRLARLPLYEAGLTDLPAVPLLFPWRWFPSTVYSYREMRTFYGQLLGGNYAYGLKNVKICSPDLAQQCEVWDMGSVVNPVTGCIQKQGWLSLRGASSVACNGTTFDVSKANITLQDPRLLANMYPTTRGRAPYGRAAQAAAQQMFVLPSVAQDTVWLEHQSVPSATFYFKNVTGPADLARVKALYGEWWNSRWDNLAARGDLVELDLMFMNGWNPRGSASAGPGTWNIAAHALLQFVDARWLPAADVVLRVVGVVLGNSGGSTDTQVYTLQRSRTAFTLAITAVRAAHEQLFTWGAAIYTLYNTIEPEKPVGLSTHPIRQLLDQYVEPSYLLQFGSALFASAVSPPPTPVNVPWLLRLWNMYASSSGPLGTKATFHTIKPELLLARSGLQADRFTGVTPGSSLWDKYPLASMHLRIAKLSRQFAESALSLFYPTDSSVSADAALQAWVAAMLDPLGGNMQQISTDNTVTTRDALFELVGHLLYQTVYHNSANLQDFFVSHLSYALHPSSMAISTLPNPTADYSIADMVKAVTNTDILSRKMSFVFAFIGAAPLTQLVPGTLNYTTGQAAPQWDADLPYIPGASAAGDGMNAAVIKFRKDVTDLFDKEPRGSIKVTNSRWGSPISMPRVISL